jgi:hypothetical protein
MRGSILSGLWVAACLAGAFGFAYWNRSTLPAALPPAETNFRTEDIQNGGPRPGGIPAIDDPTYENAIEADQYLNDDGLGLDLALGGQRYFFPYQLLVWHQVANVTLQNRPLVVSYCPLCEMGAVFERRVQDRELTFGVSGKLWNDNLLMFDQETQTLWSQILGRAVNGELIGANLTSVPAQVMAWRDWKASYPDGQVLSRQTGFVRDYTRNPYGNYAASRSVLFPVTGRDDRLAPKSLVLGAAVNGTAGAYLLDAAKQELVINEAIGGEPVLIAFDPVGQTSRAFSRQSGDQTLTFSAADGRLADRETESVWNLNGLAVRGPLQGQRLDEIPLLRLFWFCWAAAYPGTTLHLP